MSAESIFVLEMSTYCYCVLLFHANPSDQPGTSVSLCLGTRDSGQFGPVPSRPNYPNSSPLPDSSYPSGPGTESHQSQNRNSRTTAICGSDAKACSERGYCCCCWLTALMLNSLLSLR